MTFKSLILNRWIPITFGIVQLVIVSVICWTLERHQNTDREERIQIEAEYLASYIETDLNTRIPSLQRMVNRWQMREETPKSEFVRDAEDHIADAVGYQAIEWIDENYIIRWIIPLEGNEAAVGLDIAFEEKRRKTLEAARNLKVPSMSPPIDLVQGMKGFLVYYPIFIEDEFDGFILAVFDIEEWLEDVFKTNESLEEIRNFRALVSFDGVEVFQQDDWDNLDKLYLCATSNFTILDHSFEVKVLPTNGFMKSTNTFLPEMIFITAIFISILLFASITLFQKAIKEEEKTRIAKETLEKEINDRTATQEELRISESRWEFAVDGSDLGLWDWNTITNEVFFSKQWKKMLGYEDHEIKGSLEEWDSRVHPDDKEDVYRDINFHLEGKTDIYLNEYRVLCKSGQSKWIMDRGKVLEWDNDGKPKRMIGTHTDIHNRKIAEEKIRDINRRMGLAADSAGIGIWELDLKTNELVWDEWMFKIYGINENDFDGATEAWMKSIHPDDQERVVEDFTKSVSEIGSFDTEFRVILPDSTVRIIKANAIPSKIIDGEPTRMVGINYDITEQKQAEHAKEEAAKLHTAIQLAQAVAHEFRQPMTTLNLISSIMMMENIDIETAQKSIKKIPDAVGKINRLVDELVKLQDVKTMHYTENMDIIDITKSSGSSDKEENA